MNWNFRELYYGVCEDVRDTTLTMLAKRWSNEIISDFYTRYDWSWSKGETTLLTAADTMLYALPEYASGLINIRDRSAYVDLELLSSAQFQQRYPNPTSTGNSRCAVYSGFVSVKQPIQSAITLVSSSAADTGLVTVKGISEGYEQSESVTLTGLTEVDTTKTYARVISVTASSAVTGTITLYDAADNTLGTIAASGTSASITAQPATKIVVVSSSDNDKQSTDASDILRLRGYDGSDVYLEETINLNGTTSVTSTNSYNRVEEVIKKQASDGTITVTSGSRAVTKIAPTKLSAEYLQIALYPIPDTARSLDVRFKIKPPKLTQDHEGFHPIPQECFSVLKDGVMSKAWDYLKYPDRSNLSMQKYIDGIARMWSMDCKRVPSQATVGGAMDSGRIINYPRTVGT